MAAHVLQGFLPCTADFLRSNPWTRPVWEVIFPPEVLELCPTPAYPVSLGWGTVTVRWPLVAIFIVIGILGGICLGAHLLLPQKRGSPRASGYFMWGFACLSYGFMCLGALFTHCIETNHPHVFYLMDVVATGCSGVSAVGGFLCVWKVIDDRRRIWQIAAVSVYALFVILAMTGTPLIRDQIYIAPCVACVYSLVHHRKNYGRKARLLQLVSPDDCNAKAAEKWLDLGVLGATLALGSVLADRWLCYIFGSHGSFLVWVFMGCDMALFSAYQYVTVLRTLPPGPSSSVKSKAK